MSEANVRIDPLDEQLREWGIAKARRHVRVEQPNYTVMHPLERAREFAPGTRARAAMRLAGRNGHSRLVIIGYAAGLMSRDEKPRPLPAPSWVCDPIPCNDTRKRTPKESVTTARNARPAAAIDTMPDHLRWIDSAAARMPPIQALVLAVEYQEAGNQRMKAGIASRRYGGELSIAQYKRALRSARDWLRGVRC